MRPPRRLRRQRHPRHRHAVGRRRHEPLGHRAASSPTRGSPTSRCPPAYTHPTAAAVRESGGVSAQGARPRGHRGLPRRRGRARRHRGHGGRGPPVGGLRGAYLDGLALCFEAMWDLAMEMLGEGRAGALRALRARLDRARRPRPPTRGRSARASPSCWRAPGHPPRSDEELLAAVDAWRASAHGPAAVDPAPSATPSSPSSTRSPRATWCPYLPAALRARAARQHPLPAHPGRLVLGLDELPGPRPRRRRQPAVRGHLRDQRLAARSRCPSSSSSSATRSCPGHVTTFAYLQDLYVRGEVGFEATVLTMNTRAAALFEGIANNAILIAHGVTEVDGPARRGPADRRAARAAAGRRQEPVVVPDLEGGLRRRRRWRAVLRRDYLVSEERADKLSGAWGRHPLLGRMYLPAYRAGTERVAELRAPPSARRSCCRRSTAAAAWWTWSRSRRRCRRPEGRRLALGTKDRQARPLKSLTGCDARRAAPLVQRAR